MAENLMRSGKLGVGVILSCEQDNWIEKVQGEK